MDLNNKTYLGYVFNKGRHNGAVTLHGINELVDFILKEDTLSNDKIITDVYDNKVLNTLGIYVDQFGLYATKEERDAILSLLIPRQGTLFCEPDEDDEDIAE